MRTAAIVCGAGVSSTFLARAVRTLAIERGLDWQVEPLAEDELPRRIDELAIVLVGSHLGARFAALQTALAASGVPAALLETDDHTAAAEQGVALLQSLEAALLGADSLDADSLGADSLDSDSLDSVSKGHPHG